MTGEYEADSLLLGSRVAFKLVEENPPPWPCRRGGDAMPGFDAHSRYEHYDPR